MKKRIPTPLKIVLVAAPVVALALRSRSTDPPLATVPQVDLARYAGRWYEIARFPNRFERECDSDVTATYTVRPDGKINVVNACRTPDGLCKISKGTARAVDATNARLKVTFFWPFSGDYWIIELGENYEYSVISEPTRRYLWVLSRTPELPGDLERQVWSRLNEREFDTAKLIRPRHTQPE